MWIVVLSILSVFLMIVLYVYYLGRWKHLWAMDERIPSYEVKSRIDDTLKVVMIGDSWAGLHHDGEMDSFLCSLLQDTISCPVSVLSKGKGGEKAGVFIN